MDNSRIFDEPEKENEKDKNKNDIFFEYKSYITHEKLNKKTNVLLYVIEKGTNPYVYYLMNKVNDIITLPTFYLKNVKDSFDYMKETFQKSNYKYNGCIFYNDENYLLFQIELFDGGMIPIYQKDSWWKVLPFELIYSKKVLQYKIDSVCCSFFANHPNLLYLFNKTHKFEVPIVAYVGTGESLLNNFILLDENQKNGIYGKGYYFTSLEEAYFHALYDDLEPKDTLLKLLNNKYINDLTPVTDRKITIKNNKFYMNDTFIGEVPLHCGKSKNDSRSEFTLHNYDENFIYLKSSSSLKQCKNKRNLYFKRKEDGCLLKYVVFLKHSKIVLHKMAKKYDSYCGKDPNHFLSIMVKNSLNFECISYHMVEKENVIDLEFMEKKNKTVSVHIK
jgi:hypothetical protein